MQYKKVSLSSKFCSDVVSRSGGVGVGVSLYSRIYWVVVYRANVQTLTLYQYPIQTTLQHTSIPYFVENKTRMTKMPIKAFVF